MKKVLISFSQLSRLCSPDNCRPPNDDYLAAIMGSRMRKWFEAQPDASDPRDIREDDQEKYQEWLRAMLKSYGYEDDAPEIVPSIHHWISRGRPEAAFSKMETTGGENDN